MSEPKHVTARILIVAIALIWIVFLPTSCSIHETDAIADAIKHGVDPAVAKCVLKSGGSDSACLAVSRK